MGPEPQETVLRTRDAVGKEKFRDDYRPRLSDAPFQGGMLFKRGDEKHKPTGYQNVIRALGDVKCSPWRWQICQYWSNLITLSATESVQRTSAAAALLPPQQHESYQTNCLSK